jgi:pyruvate/2-oxoglutarate dehydrogenase complex dihydrolipoamide acyltransferase (E2) component
VNDLANRARQNQLKPDEIQGGTFTLTNVGTFGNVMGTPIINQPQVAIMATGAIRKKPAVLETEYGDVIAVRQMMFLSLSYDHRVVDGALGGSFLRRVADYGCSEHFLQIDIIIEALIRWHRVAPLFFSIYITTKKYGFFTSRPALCFRRA